MLCWVKPRVSWMQNKHLNKSDAFPTTNLLLFKPAFLFIFPALMLVKERMTLPRQSSWIVTLKCQLSKSSGGQWQVLSSKWKSYHRVLGEGAVWTFAYAGAEVRGVGEYTHKYAHLGFNSNTSYMWGHHVPRATFPVLFHFTGSTSY